VTLLEHPYPAFMGLNLMYETRLGLACKYLKARRRSGGGPKRSLAMAAREYGGTIAKAFGLDDATQRADEVNCTLEGQVADVADRIAYNCHDLEDGLRARLIAGSQMRDIEIYVEAARQAGVDQIEDWTIRRTRTAKTIVDRLVGDCIDTSARNIAEAGIETAYDACARPENLVGLSQRSDLLLADLERFLASNFYHHEMLMEAAAKARYWLTELFDRLCQEPDLMPGYFQRFIPEYGLQRAVCDYLAGMTDRFCLKMLGRIDPASCR
jgi:dGTPase